MSQEARARIESHPLMRKEEVSIHTEKVEHIHRTVQEHKLLEKSRFKKRLFVHVGIFILSFIFTSGLELLGIILWVKPDSLLSLVFVSVFSATVFVVSFTVLRVVILHHFFNEYLNADEDPGMFHHVSKSIAYALVALVVAVILTGFFVKLASAGIL